MFVNQVEPLFGAATSQACLRLGATRPAMKLSSRTFVAQVSLLKVFLQKGDLLLEPFFTGSRLAEVRFQSGLLALGFHDPAIEFLGLGNQVAETRDRNGESNGGRAQGRRSIIYLRQK